MDVASDEALVGEILELKEFNANNRRTILAVSMLKLANESPQATLRLLPRFLGNLPDADDERKLRAGLLNTALEAWAKTDAPAAAAWVKESTVTFPEPVTEKTKFGLLSKAGARDPSTAFNLIDKLEIEDKAQAILTIASAPRTAEERSSTLAALRG